MWFAFLEIRSNCSTERIFRLSYFTQAQSITYEKRIWYTLYLWAIVATRRSSHPEVYFIFSGLLSLSMFHILMFIHNLSTKCTYQYIRNSCMSCCAQGAMVTHSHLIYFHKFYARCHHQSWSFHMNSASKKNSTNAKVARPWQVNEVANHFILFFNLKLIINWDLFFIAVN